MKIYTGIKKAYTFQGFAKKNGIKPDAKDLKPIKNAALVINSKGLIEWIGFEKDLNLKLFSKFKNLKGVNIFPSFTESHTHLAFGGDRKKEFEQKIKGLSYIEIQKSGGGINKTIKDTKKISFDDLLKSSQERVNNFKKQGVSLLEIKSGYGQEDYETEIKQLKVISRLKGINITPTYLALHSYKKDKESYINRVLNSDLKKVIGEFPSLKRVDLFVERSFFNLSDLDLFVENN